MHQIPLENHVITFTDAPYEEPKVTYVPQHQHERVPSYTHDELVQELKLYPHFAIGDKVICETNNLGVCEIHSFETNPNIVYKFKDHPSMVRVQDLKNKNVFMLVTFPELTLIHGE